jgi:nucleoside-diphosphate-sugar epimerase
MRVLVTGASGFIGRHVVRELALHGCEVHGVGRESVSPHTTRCDSWHQVDMLDANTPRRLAAVGADLLIHCAWVTAHGSYWESPENVAWRSATNALVRAFKDSGGRRFIGVGTCAEYDLQGGSEPLHEERSALKPTTLYGQAKSNTHIDLNQLANDSPLSVAWARLFHLYGPGEDPKRLVPSIITSILRGQPAKCTSGHQIRDFMHAADAGAAIAQLALSNIRGPVNVASGTQTTIEAVAKHIGDLMGRRDLIALGALPDRPGDPLAIVADVTRLRSELGFSPRHDLRQGLEETIAWWRAQARGM